MSTALLPKFEQSKSASALVTLIFLSELLLFSHLGQLPRLTDRGTFFGLVILALIPASWLLLILGTSKIGVLLEKIAQYISRFIPHIWGIKNSDYIRKKLAISFHPWIGGQIPSLRKQADYRRLRDGPIAEFLFGLATIVMALLLKREQSNLLASLTGIQVELSSSQIKWTFCFLVGISALLIGKSIWDTSGQFLIMLDLIWLRNIRYSEGGKRTDILERARQFILLEDWEGLHGELKVWVLSPAVEKLKHYQSALETLQMFLEFCKQSPKDFGHAFTGFIEGANGENRLGTSWKSLHSLPNNKSNNNYYWFGSSLIQPLKVHSDHYLMEMLFGHSMDSYYQSKLVNGNMGAALNALRLIDEILLNFSALLFLHQMGSSVEYETGLKFQPKPMKLDDLRPRLTIEDLNESKELFYAAIAIGAWLMSKQQSSSFVLVIANEIITGNLNNKQHFNRVKDALDLRWNDLALNVSNRSSMEEWPKGMGERLKGWIRSIEEGHKDYSYYPMGLIDSLKALKKALIKKPIREQIDILLQEREMFVDIVTKELISTHERIAALLDSKPE